MKPRRDITLGEMQDECKRIGDKTGGICVSSCEYYKFCPVMTGEDFEHLDLTDPPRFNEKQTALLRGILGIGCVTITRTKDDAYRCLDKNGEFSYHLDALGLKTGETLDLAEMFGKDGD